MTVPKKKSLVLVAIVLTLALCGVLTQRAGAIEVAPQKAIEEGFALRLAAVSPDGGWDSPGGKSADAGLQLIFRDINSTRKGLQGLEVVIEKVDQPLDESSARHLVRDLRGKGVLGIICFARDFPARFVAQAAADSGMPLILCHAETLPLGKTPASPHPFLFSLDLDKSFRPRAIAAWAGRHSHTPWFIFADRVDKYLSDQGERTDQTLRGSGITPEVFWFVSGSVQNIIGRLTESTEEDTPWIVSWLSPLTTLRLYSTAKRESLPINLFHGDTPSDLLRAHEGIFVVDQAVPLRDKSLLGPLGDRLWSTWGSAHYGITEEAARGALAAEWFRLAIERLPSVPEDRMKLARSMEKVRELRLEELRVPLSARTHRPEEREVSVLRSSDNSWEEVARLTVRQE